MKKLFKPALLAGLLAMAAGAYAQDANVDPMTAHHARMDPAKRDAMMARHMQRMHDKLKIQPSQEAAWKTFAASMKPMGMPPQPAAADAKLSAPERMEKMMQAHQQMQQQHLEALKTFYKQLTPEQQKIMDQMHADMGPKARGMRGKRMASAPANG